MNAPAHTVRIARDEGFDGIAGKPFLDHFHWSNGDGGQMCIESCPCGPTPRMGGVLPEQYRERRERGQVRAHGKGRT